MKLEQALNNIEHGRFRILKRIDNDFSVIDDYESFIEARAVARIMMKQEDILSKDEIYFFIFDYLGIALYGINCGKEIHQ